MSYEMSSRDLMSCLMSSERVQAIELAFLVIPLKVVLSSRRVSMQSLLRCLSLVFFMGLDSEQKQRVILCQVQKKGGGF